MTGAGTLILSGNNTFTGSGDFLVQSGILELASTSALGSLGSVRVSGSAGASATLAVSGGITIAQEVLLLGKDSRLLSMSGSNTWSGTVAVENGSPQFEVDADQLLITGEVTQVSSNTHGGLVKTGMGTLVLGHGNNFYHEGTEVADGVLAVQSNGALGSGAVTVDDGGTLELAPLPGFGLSFNQTLTLSGSGFENEGALRSVNVLNSWTGPIQLVDVVSIGADSALALNGAISGDSLAKVGAGRLSLTTANSYTGATLVLAGELDLYNAQALGSTTIPPSGTEGVTVYAGATLGLDTRGTFVFPLALLDHGELLAGASATWGGPVTLAGTAQVSVNASNVLALSGFLSGTSDARLQEIGGGTLELLAPPSLGTFATVLGPGPSDANQIEIDSGSLMLGQSGTIAASLSVSLASGFTPAIGQQFTIIHNLRGLPITGKFASLSEGSTFTVDGFTFQITYQGGTGGHDVVVTRTA
jgi:autotransporter-associated beta strand protein